MLQFLKRTIPLPHSKRVAIGCALFLSACVLPAPVTLIALVACAIYVPAYYEAVVLAAAYDALYRPFASSFWSIGNMTIIVLLSMILIETLRGRVRGFAL